MPLPQPTTCIFGGHDLDVLYITTSRLNMTPEQLERYPLSGSVLAVQPGVRGVPEPLFAGKEAKGAVSGAFRSSGGTIWTCLATSGFRLNPGSNGQPRRLRRLAEASSHPHLESPTTQPGRQRANHE
jgi:hypothetical protein